MSSTFPRTLSSDCSTKKLWCIANLPIIKFDNQNIDRKPAIRSSNKWLDQEEMTTSWLKILLYTTQSHWIHQCVTQTVLRFMPPALTYWWKLTITQTMTLPKLRKLLGRHFELIGKSVLTHIVLRFIPSDLWQAKKSFQMFSLRCLCKCLKKQREMKEQHYCFSCKEANKMIDVQKQRRRNYAEKFFTDDIFSITFFNKLDAV